MIDVFDIQEKVKPFDLTTAVADDFILLPAGQADSAIILDDPTISLYCLDHTSRRALFVQVPPDVDITALPFFYKAQYDYALRVYGASYETLHQLASTISLDGRVVFIYSTGRAGSTLMSKVFGEMETTMSLSEPDVYTQAQEIRLAERDDDTVTGLLADATKLLFKPTFITGSTLLAIKFRSYGIEVADLLAKAFPSAGNLFLYRDLKACVVSYLRGFGGDLDEHTGALDLASYFASLFPFMEEEVSSRSQIDYVEVFTLLWLSVVERYAHLHAAGVPILAVRYEELNADPKGSLRTILAYLGLPADHLPSGLRAFARDSQKGTMAARDLTAQRQVHINEHRWNLVRDLIRRYPIAAPPIPAASLAVG